MGEVGFPSSFLRLMILSFLSRLTCRSHLFENSADLLFIFCMAFRVICVPFYLYPPTVSITCNSLLDHEP